MAGLAAVACSSFDDIKPEGGTLLEEQLLKTYEVAPQRADASFNGLFTPLGAPLATSPDDDRADDFAFIMNTLCNDVEGADIVMPDSGYNWFSTCCNYGSRNANYWNPYLRYATPYRQIANCNTYIASFPEDAVDTAITFKVAQAKALRAFSYQHLVFAYQFGYLKDPTAPCVPLVTEKTTDFANNPRASVEDVYALILSDLDYAVAHLEGYVRPSKMNIDKQVAFALRARAHLAMGHWEEAYNDADSASIGYTPKSIAEVSKPTFYDIAEHDWLWGYDMIKSVAEVEPYATADSWLRSFSGDGYAAGAGTYMQINKMLWDKIPSTDVRKGWWVDESLESPLLNGLKWDGKGDIANLKIENVKEIFLPYTNVKFGMKTIGSVDNDNDYPFIRVDEMILIKAEALAHQNKNAEATQLLTDYVTTYRDPSYTVSAARNLIDEIWFQRRVELWGEGFYVYDMMRLQKPLVRFKDNAASTNWPTKYRFNIAADDDLLLLRFSQSELNTNMAIVDNPPFIAPKTDQNPGLRDGVTD